MAEAAYLDEEAHKQERRHQVEEVAYRDEVAAVVLSSSDLVVVDPLVSARTAEAVEAGRAAAAAHRASVHTALEVEGPAS